MLFFLHHCELPSLDLDVPRVNPAPVDIRLLLVPRLPPDIPQRENIPQQQVEDPQNETPVEQTTSETSALSVEEQNEDTLQRTELHRIKPCHNTVLPEASVEPTQQGGQSGQPQQLLTEEELRKVRLQHFERKRD